MQVRFIKYIKFLSIPLGLVMELTLGSVFNSQIGVVAGLITVATFYFLVLREERILYDTTISNIVTKVLQQEFGYGSYTEVKTFSRRLLVRVYFFADTTADSKRVYRRIIDALSKNSIGSYITIMQVANAQKKENVPVIRRLFEEQLIKQLISSCTEKGED